MRYEELKGAYELPIDENDDIASMIDSVLSRPGLRLRYVRSGSDDWVSMIGDQDMEEGVRTLPELDQKILKLFFLDRKSLFEIAAYLDLPIELVIGRLKAVKVRLAIYV